MSSQPQAAGVFSARTLKTGKLGRVSERRKQAEAQAQLVQTVGKLTAEVEALQQRLTEIEHIREIEHTREPFRVPQSLAELGPRRLPPPGQTAMQAIRGKLEVDEPIEDLLAQLKALG